MTNMLIGSAVSGAKWTGLSIAMSTLLQLLSLAVMARLLEPAAFGLLAMANVALRLFSYLSQLGMGAAVVQRETLSRDEVRRAMGWTLLVCSCATGIAVWSAGLIAAFFGMAALAPVVHVLAINLLLQGLAVIPLALLRRRLEFKALALLEIGTYCGYVVVGITVAWLGGGVWSLVAATLSQSALQLLAAAWLARIPLVPALLGDSSNLFRYGLRHSVGGFVEFLTSNLDTAVVGRFIGDAALGIYSRAALLVFLPLEKMSSVVGKVFFPLLSQLQQQRTHVGSALLLGVSFIGLGSAVFCYTLSVAAPELVAVLLGPGWHDAAAVISVLALAGSPGFMTVMAGVVCDALALLRMKLRLQLFGLVLLSALCLVFYRDGLVGIAWAIVLAQAAVHAAYMAYLAPLLRCRRRDVVRAYCAVVATAGIAYLAAAAVLAPLRYLGAPPALCLLAAALTALLSLVFGLHIWFRLMQHSAPDVLALGRIPRWAIWRGRLLGDWRAR